MKGKKDNTDLNGRKADGEKNGLHEYPLYVTGEDIYNKYDEEENIDTEDVLTIKSTNEKGDTVNEKSFTDDVSGGDLDVPGSELDDEQENTGSEDEENNYYSLGGDDHNDLEEDRGE